MKNVPQILWVLIGILEFCAFVYGSYWLVKNVSYWFFYEDLVKETIREMIDKKYLIGV